MKNFYFFACVTLVAFCTACKSGKNNYSVEYPMGEILINVDIPGWKENPTKAECIDPVPEGALLPVNVLLVEKGRNLVSKKVNMECSSTLTLNVPVGEYDIYAICGLPDECIPNNVDENIDIPDDTSGHGLTVFACGKESITVGAAGTSSSLEISAQRQVSWLEVAISGMPEGVKKARLYISDLYETYSISGGWDVAFYGVNNYAQIPLFTKTGENGIYRADTCIAPSFESQGTRFIVEMTSAGGNTSYYAYTSPKTLEAGTHLVLNLSFSQMALVEGGIVTGNWNEQTDEGNVTQIHNFSIGDRYLSYQASVISIGETTISLFPHKPLMVSPAHIRQWTDVRYVNYDLMPEVNVSRWALPRSQQTPNSIMYMLGVIGIDVMNSRLTVEGNDSIDLTAENVLAFWDKNTDKFYRYDFQNNTFEVIADENAEYKVYPIGIINIAK